MGGRAPPLSRSAENSRLCEKRGTDTTDKPTESINISTFCRRFVTPIRPAFAFYVRLISFANDENEDARDGEFANERVLE